MARRFFWRVSVRGGASRGWGAAQRATRSRTVQAGLTAMVRPPGRLLRSRNERNGRLPVRVRRRERDRNQARKGDSVRKAVPVRDQARRRRTARRPGGPAPDRPDEATGLRQQLPPPLAAAPREDLRRGRDFDLIR